MATRLTRIIGGNGTDQLAFTLDPGLLQYVQSVFVEIDNSGGGDAQPTLTIATTNGQALAKKQQGRSIPAGDTGSATWALRLDDESAGSSAVTGQLGTYLGGPTVVPTGTTTRFTFAYDLGDDLLDLTFTDFPGFKAAGVYVLRVFAFASPTFNAPGKVARLISFMDAFGFTDQGMTANNIPLDTGPNGPEGSIAWPWIGQAGELFCVALDHDRGVNSTWVCYLNVMKIG